VDSDEFTFEVNVTDNQSSLNGTFTIDGTVDASDAEGTDNRIRHTITADDGSEVTADYKLNADGNVVAYNAGDSTVYQGEVITFDADGTESTITIYATDDDGNKGQRVTTVGNTSPGDKVNYDSSNLDLGDYVVEFTGGQTDTVNLSVLDLGLTAEAESTEINTNNDIAVNIGADGTAGGEVVNATLLNSDGDVVDYSEVELDGVGEANVDFSASEAGDYTVEVEHESTGITAETDTITVSEAPDEDVEFADHASVALGNNAGESRLTWTTTATPSTSRLVKRNTTLPGTGRSRRW